MTANGMSRGARARAAEWVVGALTLEHRDPQYARPPELPDLTTALALHHGVEGWVSHRARAAGTALPGIDEAVRGAVARHQRTVAELGFVDAALTAAAVPFAVVKGPALVSQFYRGPRWRSSVDLDLLVRPRHVDRALRALEAGGAVVLDANWPMLGPVGVHELVVQGPAGGAIDLHWSLGPRWGTASQSPSASTLLARARRITIDGVRTLTLDWGDTVVHLASHAAAAGGNRLLWCVDLRAALAVAPAHAVELLVQRAAEWSAAPAVHLMLDRAGHSLGVVPPAGLVRQLDPRGGWSALVRGVEAAFPIARDAGGASLSRLVARSTRADAAASWRALAGRAARGLGQRLGIGSGPLRGPEDPRSAFYPAGGPGARASFLAGLEALEA